MGLLTSTRQYNRELYNKYSLCTKWICEIENRTPNNLFDILMQHRKMWAEGLQNSYFGPDKYGMFRTDSIDNLDMNTLYLGNINGIWTHRASFYESPDFKFQDPENHKYLTNDYIAICQQYKKHLVSNLRAMRSNIYDHGYNREKICSHIMVGYAAIHPNDSIENLKILNESIADNKVIDVSFSYNGRTINSTFVNIGGEFFFPKVLKWVYVSILLKLILIIL